MIRRTWYSHLTKAIEHYSKRSATKKPFMCSTEKVETTSAANSLYSTLIQVNTPLTSSRTIEYRTGASLPPTGEICHNIYKPSIHCYPLTTNDKVIIRASPWWSLLTRIHNGLGLGGRRGGRDLIAFTPSNLLQGKLLRAQATCKW